MVDAVKILGSLLASGALSKGSGNNALGSVLGAALGGGGGRQGGGNPMMDVLGSLMGGGRQGGSGGGGGSGLAGAVLGSLLKGGGGGGAPQSGGGGLGGMLGGLLGGGGQPQSAPTARGGAGGMGDLLGSLLGGGQAQGQGGGLGGLLGGAVAKYAQSQNPGAPAGAAAQLMPAGMSDAQAEQQATVIVRAMINAAKADGQVDQKELQQITGKMGQMDQDEIQWLRTEISVPLDVKSFVASVPRGMEQQIYAMSLMAIDLDTQQEAKYLHELAQGLGIPANVCNQLHEQLGAPKIFA